MMHVPWTTVQSTKVNSKVVSFQGKAPTHLERGVWFIVAIGAKIWQRTGENIWTNGKVRSMETEMGRKIWFWHKFPK